MPGSAMFSEATADTTSASATVMTARTIPGRVSVVFTVFLSIRRLLNNTVQPLRLYFNA
jgi:hypothetical protein